MGLWGKLIKRLSTQEQLWAKSGKPKSSKDTFLLFDVDRLTNSSSRKSMIQAFKDCSLDYKSPHDCRHTRGTFLYGKTQSKELCKLWMGHVVDKVFERYNHTYEVFCRELRSGFNDDSFSWKDFANND